jgi:hypothetical protein
LVQSLFQAGVARLHASDLFLDVLEFVQAGVKYVGKVFALVLNIFAFLLESLQSKCQPSIFIVAPLIFVLDLLDLEPNSLDFRGPGIILSFEVSVAPEQLFNQQIGLLELNSEIIDLGPQLNNALFVDVRLDSD